MTGAPTTPPESLASTDPPRRDRRPMLMVGSIVLALALTVGLVWLAGGFERRTDIRIEVAAGTRISTGPYEFTFDRATVQKTTNYSDEPIWKIVATGSGCTTGDEAITPSTLNWMFAAKDPRGGPVEEPQSQRFGPDTRTGSGYFFTPGLPPIEYRLEFWFPIADLQPGERIQLAVFELEFRDTSLLQTSQETWANAQRFYAYDLPVERLPDDVD